MSIAAGTLDEMMYSCYTSLLPHYGKLESRHMCMVSLFSFTNVQVLYNGTQIKLAIARLLIAVPGGAIPIHKYSTAEKRRCIVAHTMIRYSSPRGTRSTPV